MVLEDTKIAKKKKKAQVPFITGIKYWSYVLLSEFERTMRPWRDKGELAGRNFEFKFYFLREQFLSPPSQS